MPIFGIILVLLFLLLLVYGFYFVRHRKSLIKKLAQQGSLPPPYEQAALIEGVVTGPEKTDLNGNKVGFLGLDVFTKRASTTRKAVLESIHAFKFVYFSGDFSIQDQAGQLHTVGLMDYYQQLHKGTQAYAEVAANLLTGEGQARREAIAQLEANNAAAESAMMTVFNYFANEFDSTMTISVPFYQRSSSVIRKVNSRSNIDSQVYNFVVGQNLPAALEQILTEQQVRSMLVDGDEIFVVELTIPVGHQVFAVGTKDLSTNSLNFRNAAISLSVSYTNPAL